MKYKSDIIAYLLIAYGPASLIVFLICSVIVGIQKHATTIIAYTWIISLILFVTWPFVILSICSGTYEDERK